MNPPATAADFSTLPPEIIYSHILSRLDGPSLASIACCSTVLRRLSSPQSLWLNVCLSTWPSTASPRLTRLLSTFPGGGPRSFFAHAFPLAELPLVLTPPSPLPELLSAVDIHYNGNLIFSKLHSIKTDRHSTLQFRVDLIKPDGIITASTKKITVESRADDFGGIMEGMTLSWILIDPLAQRAANLSSYKPVGVRRLRVTGELRQVKFSSFLGREDDLVQCEIMVTFEGEMQIKEVTLEIEGLNWGRFDCEESLLILQGALESKNVPGKNRVRESRLRYREFEKMKGERTKRKWRKEDNREMFLWFECFLFVFFFFWICAMVIFAIFLGLEMVWKGKV